MNIPKEDVAKEDGTDENKEFGSNELPLCKDGKEACMDCLMRGECLIKMENLK